MTTLVRKNKNVRRVISKITLKNPLPESPSAPLPALPLVLAARRIAAGSGFGAAVTSGGLKGYY
jgi:hypothetical protein